MLKWLRKNSLILMFFNVSGMTAVTIQSNKTVLNEIKEKLALY